MPIELAAAFDGAIKRFSPLEEETPAAPAPAAVQIQFRATFVSANPEHPAPLNYMYYIPLTRFVHSAFFFPPRKQSRVEREVFTVQIRPTTFGRDPRD